MNPYLYFLIGPPGCGKSRFRKFMLSKRPDFKVVSFDDRLHYYQVKYDLSYAEAFTIFGKQGYEDVDKDFLKYIDKKTNIIFDMTNLTVDGRKERISVANDSGYALVAVDFDWTIDLIKVRNEERKMQYGKEIPEYVIDDMIRRYESPSSNEGFSCIIHVRSEIDYNNLDFSFTEMHIGGMENLTNSMEKIL